MTHVRPVIAHRYISRIHIWPILVFPRNGKKKQMQKRKALTCKNAGHDLGIVSSKAEKIRHVVARRGFNSWNNFYNLVCAPTSRKGVPLPYWNSRRNPTIDLLTSKSSAFPLNDCLYFVLLIAAASLFWKIFLFFISPPLAPQPW